MKKLYIVTINRSGKIETVKLVTPNLTKAQSHYVGLIRGLGKSALAHQILELFSDGELTDDASTTIADDENVVVQLTTYEAEVSPV